jgi:hypothetical protein
VRAWVLVLVGCGRVAFDPLDDNCGGHDEDGDGVGDACDVCPTVADSDQRDVGELNAGALADGVGDACDPRPALAGDYVLWFDSHADSASTSYLGVYDDYSWQSDALRLGTLTASGAATYQLTAYPSRLSFVARIIDVSAQQHWFGVWYNEPGINLDRAHFRLRSRSSPSASSKPCVSSSTSST